MEHQIRGASSYILVCVLSLSGWAQAQTGTPDGRDMMAVSLSKETPADQGLAIRVIVNSVVLNASVRDRQTNRSIGGLTSDDFRVYEDGVLQQLQQTRITDAPYNLLLLMDVSGSTYSYMQLMKKAAIDFIYGIGLSDRIAIASFNSKVRLQLDFTSDVDAAAKAIARLHSGGGTAFYDALITCVDQYMRGNMRGIQGRKAIVVFTDGVDNALSGNPREGSRASYQDLYDTLQEADTLVYTIFLNSTGKEMMPASETAARPSGGKLPGLRRLPFPFPLPTQTQSPFPLPWPGPSKVPSVVPNMKPRTRPAEDNHDAFRTAHDQLEEIAQLTGGRTYAPRKIQELSGTYTEVADDLRIQYLLSYASSNTAQGDGWRSIRVEVKNHTDAVVRTRKGYSVPLRHR